jgi:hypothetical protein
VEIFDLTPLKGKLQNDTTFHERNYKIIKKYNVIVISPDVDQ